MSFTPASPKSFNDTVCSSSYIAWYGDTLYETGVYPMAFQTIDGCDSIEYLHFANYPNYDLEYYDTICDYSGVMRLGVEYLGVAHLPTMHGCDSNEVYHLWGMPVSYSSVDTIISERQIPFGYNGEWFADSGTTQQQFILTNQYGCDSIINFTITVMPTVRQTLDSSICDGAMPLEWDGTVFNYVAGIADYELIDTLAGAYGADSIVTRRVHVSPSYDISYVDGKLTIEEASGIQTITFDVKAGNVYDMSGRRIRENATTLEGLSKGVYIFNGHKVVKE